jgi:hypothetical protein
MGRLFGAATGALALLAFAFVASSLLAERDATITVNPQQTYQTMRGREVTVPAWETNKKLDRFDSSWESHRDALVQLLANELGIDQSHRAAGRRLWNSIYDRPRNGRELPLVKLGPESALTARIPSAGVITSYQQ